MKKLLISSVGLVVIAVGFIMVRSADAYLPGPYDRNGVVLRDGDLISASEYGDPDIFIIKFKPHFDQDVNPGDGGERHGYKRLFLNPAIFNMYGHLGGFANVHKVVPGVRDAFTTSGLFRNCESDDRRVWATEVTGEDEGILHHVEMSGEQAVSEDPNFFDRVFCINNREDAFYARSIAPYYRLRDIPRYFRRACRQRPTCLDTEPRCYVPEPAEGWCPWQPQSCVPEGGFAGIPADNPCCAGLQPISGRGIIGGGAYCTRPGCYYQEVQCVRAPCNPVLVCPELNCSTLPNCALPGANPACDIASYGPDGRPWCPFVNTD